MTNPQYTLRKLADFLHADLRGDASCGISGIAPLDKAQVGYISFLDNPSYKSHLTSTAASAVIVRSEDLPADIVSTSTSTSTSSSTSTSASFIPPSRSFLIVKDPYLAYAKISALFAAIPSLPCGIHKTAIIGGNCQIDVAAVAIGAYCVIGNGVTIGKNVVIEPGSVIGNDVIIGDDTRLYANVTLYYGVRVGKRCTIHSGVVIGADGFGMANDGGVWRKIYQLGSVVIGDDVEIGANTTIDRGALVDTCIEDGVKLDNQIQVGHNVQIGAHTAIAGSTGIAGSTKIGKHCMIGGGCGINGHITIADGTVITARSGVYKSITAPEVYAGAIPAVPHRTWWRILKRIFQLDDISLRVKKLEKKCYEQGKQDAE